MKKLFLALLVFTLALPVIAEEATINKETQKINNDNAYLGVNFMKQPEENGGQQLIANKKSFLFINVIINGKPLTVKEKEAEVK